jgi:hypothetical protein
MIAELDRLHTDGFTVSVDCHRPTGHSATVIDDAGTASQTALAVPGVGGADAFRHPFRSAP